MPTPSASAIDARVRAFAADSPAPWIVGGGWDPTLHPATGPRIHETRKAATIAAGEVVGG